MLYQKLLIGRQPYFISISGASSFENHRHPEIELSYCMEGTYDVICEKKRYTLTAGDFMVVGPMAAHEFPKRNGPGQQMTVELGYALLGEHFEALTTQLPNCRLYTKHAFENTPEYRQLIALLEETAALHCTPSAFSVLSVNGNLYKISALLLQMQCGVKENHAQSKELTDIKKIDLALETVYNRYFEPLSIEQVSALCGYSKSNFCKIFKSITGDTFHNILNRHRIEVACMLLRETNEAIEKVALETGFADAKSFCRVFKKLMGKSAGEYRKSLKGDTSMRM